MTIKLTKVESTTDKDIIVSSFNKQFTEILERSNGDIDKINKFFMDLYTKENKADGQVKSILDKFLKMIKSNLKKATKRLNDDKGRDYDVYTFDINGVLGMLLLSKKGPVLSLEFDHTMVNYNGINITSVFNDKTRTPCRVEFNGNAYPILLSDNAIVEGLKNDGMLNEMLAFSLGYVKKDLTTKNTFKGFKSLVDIAKMAKGYSSSIATDMKCTELSKSLAEAKDDDIDVIMAGISLIGINTLDEARLLGKLIESEKNETIKKAVLKKLFGM